MKKNNIVNAVIVAVAGFVMVTGSIVAYESQGNNNNLTTAGVFNYTSADYASSGTVQAVEDTVTVADAVTAALTLRLREVELKSSPRKIFASLESTKRTLPILPTSPLKRFSGAEYLWASIHSSLRIRS